MRENKNGSKFSVENFGLLVREIIELQEWKTVTVGEISNLKTRIKSLESNLSSVSCDRLPKPFLPKTTNSDGYKVPSKSSAVFSKLSPLMAVQICWLLLVLVGVTWLGGEKFLVADENEKSEWKPEKITKVIDYGASDTTVQYEMPYVDLIFSFLCGDDCEWSTEMGEETLKEIIELQHWYNTSIAYGIDLHNYDAPILVEADVLEIDSDVKDKVLDVHYFMKIDDPDPALGEFRIEIIILSDLLISLPNIADFPYLHIGLGRTHETMDFVMLSMSSSPVSIYELEYEEKVTSKMDGSKERSIKISLAGEAFWDNANNDSLVYLRFNGDLSVEHWTQYLEYSYTDWLGAAGGFISIGMTSFLFVASMAPKLIKDKSLGILPYLSLQHKNQVCINKCTDILRESTISEGILRELALSEGDSPSLNQKDETSSKNIRQDGNIVYDL